MRKLAFQTSGGKMDSITWCLDSYEKCRVGFIPHILHQDKFPIDQILNFEYEKRTLKVLEENIQEYLYLFSMGEDLQILTLSPDVTKGKNHMVDYVTFTQQNK